jgi:O-antigen ligase
MRKAAHLAGLATVGLLVFCLFFLGDGWLPANRVFTDLAIVGIVLSLVARPFPRIDLPRAWPYLAYWLALTISLSLAGNGEAWREYGRQLVFLGLLLAVARLAFPRRAVAALVVLVVASSCMVLLQAVGFSLTVPLRDRPAGYAWVAQWSGYPELGMLAAMACCACVAVAALGRWALRVASIVLAALLAVASVFLYSRSAWLTIALVALWLAALSIVRWRRWEIALLLAVVLVVAAVTARASPLAERYLATFEHAARSTELTVRINGWTSAAAMVRVHPWFGVGPGNYHVVYAQYAAFGDPTHAYNLILHNAAELGLVGLVCYLAVWARVSWVSFKNARPGSVGGAAAFAVHAMLLAFFVRSQSEHFLSALGTAFRFLLLVAIVFGLAEAMAGSTRSTRES